MLVPRWKTGRPSRIVNGPRSIVSTARAAGREVQLGRVAGRVAADRRSYRTHDTTKSVVDDGGIAFVSTHAGAAWPQIIAPARHAAFRPFKSGDVQKAWAVPTMLKVFSAGADKAIAHRAHRRACRENGGAVIHCMTAAFTHEPGKTVRLCIGTRLKPIIEETGQRRYWLRQAKAMNALKNGSPKAGG